ncbi:MAG TPA: hypothetical protein VLA80_13255 [Actinomycetota bacterium]|nr:hypothetical protein [Actinomycetota bacterium]
MLVIWALATRSPRGQVEAGGVGRAAGLRGLLDGGDQSRTDVGGEELLGLDSWRNIAGFGYL